jgi:hypothetical protein
MPGRITLSLTAVNGQQSADILNTLQQQASRKHAYKLTIVADGCLKNCRSQTCKKEDKCGNFYFPDLSNDIGHKSGGDKQQVH